MKLLTILYLGLLAAPASASEWAPPEKPDVKAILNEARDDARDGKYEQALAKHVWFHENGLKYRSSMSGVRLSFALSDWYRLGEKYPPALVKMEEVRDAVGKRITAHDGKRISFEDFQEFAAINRELDENDKTVEMFKWVDERNLKAAGRVYRVSDDALIAANEYALCGKYLDPDKSVALALTRFKLENEMKGDAKYADLRKDTLSKHFINDAATLVALLVINDRKDEAEKAVAKFKTVESDADFHEKLATALDKALAGELPEQR